MLFDISVEISELQYRPSTFSNKKTKILAQEESPHVSYYRKDVFRNQFHTT